MIQILNIRKIFQLYELWGRFEADAILLATEFLVIFYKHVLHTSQKRTKFPLPANHTEDYCGFSVPSFQIERFSPCESKLMSSAVTIPQQTSTVEAGSASSKAITG